MKRVKHYRKTIIIKCSMRQAAVWPDVDPSDFKLWSTYFGHDCDPSLPRLLTEELIEEVKSVSILGIKIPVSTRRLVASESVK